MTGLIALAVLALIVLGAVSYHRHTREAERERAREIWGDDGDSGL